MSPCRGRCPCQTAAGRLTASTNRPRQAGGGHPASRWRRQAWEAPSAAAAARFLAVAAIRARVRRDGPSMRDRRSWATQRPVLVRNASGSLLPHRPNDVRAGTELARAVADFNRKGPLLVALEPSWVERARDAGREWRAARDSPISEVSRQTHGSASSVDGLVVGTSCAVAAPASTALKLGLAAVRSDSPDPLRLIGPTGETWRALAHTALDRPLSLQHLSTGGTGCER